MGSTEVATRLESLPARPPTPPRETAHDAELSTTAKSVLTRPSALGIRSKVQTPPSLFTPDSSTTNSTNPRRLRKRVGFSAKAEYKEAYASTDLDQPRKSSPASATQSRPVKGILKPPSSASKPREFSRLSESTEYTETPSISEMLESTVKQLAGADRDAKIDAYTMIVRCLQASNNLPDRIALRDKMGLFAQFIQRDINAKNTSGTFDHPLNVKALTLLDTFLFFPAIASTIPNDFGVFIIDHCIRSFEDQTTTKDMARRLLHVVAMQDFSSRVMTADRVRRLISALHAIDGHLRGKSIVVYRLRVYHRLIQQAQPYMATHTDWLNDVFTDMLSPVKDVRNSAIKLGSEAAFIYGKEQQLSRRVLELFDTSIEEMTYIEWYREQLLKISKTTEKAVVPRIWSVIVLLIRVSFTKWRFFNQWLHLIQDCFNTSDPVCNREANFAWNRFVYTVHFDERNFSNIKMFSTLYQPIGVQLKKAGIPEQKREILLGSLCNLYYYAFRPSANQGRLDMFWDVSVKPLTDALIPRKNPDLIDDHLRRAALILSGLLDPQTQIWRDDRIRDSNIPSPEELPMIDPKWVRHNAPKIFSVITPIMDKHFCQLSDKTSPVHRLWRSLVSSVSLAASKEIKVSNDTATFISETFGLLLKYWQTGAEETQAQQFLLSVQEVVLSVVEKLGVLPFTERMISLGRLSSFMPVATPSHKPGKNLGDVRSPLQHLFGLLTRLPPGVPDNEDYFRFLQAVYSPFFTTSKSAKARSDLANEMLQTVPIWSPQASHCPFGPWAFASENLMAAMAASQNSVHSSGDSVLGHEYRAIVRHLERGWRDTPNLPWDYWHTLYAFLVNRASTESGDAGRAIGVIEPLAKMIREALPVDGAATPESTLRIATELLVTATQPRDRQALDAARRRLWGTAVTGARTASFDPFDHLYKLVNDLLARLYDAIDGAEVPQELAPLLRETGAFLARCNVQLVVKAMNSLEGGIAAWVHDKRGLMSSRRDAAQAEAVKELWTTICGLIFAEGQPQLENFEQLLCAGFESKHRQIVNITAQSWNTTFQNVEQLEYPEHLKAVLLSSQTFVDLALPGLDVPITTPSEAQGRSFVDSQDVLREISLRSSRSLPRSLPSSADHHLLPVSPGAVKLSFSDKKRHDGTPKRTRSSARSTPTSRLRHDNSQLQFVAVESSPSADQQESQHLTERQLEVRERQKDAAAIYSELRSSPRLTTGESLRQKATKSSASEALAAQMKEATPEPGTGFEDYVSSTPTPRRGQAIVIDLDDHDMTDPPSSPPEPRPFPLLPQIKSRSSSRGELDDDWPLSSSPVGSPNIEALPTTDADLPSINIADEPRPTTEASQQIVEDSFIADIVPSSAPAAPTAAAVSAPVEGLSKPTRRSSRLPSTPRRRPAAAEQETKSDEVYVDALTSPQPTTRQRGAKDTANQSFVMSDGDENSMLRLVVELDSRRCVIPMSDRPAESPEKVRTAGVRDCITVAVPAEKAGRNTKSRSPDVATENTVNSTDVPSKKKRKRSGASKHERRKKRKSTDVADDAPISSQSSVVTDRSSADWSDAHFEEEKRPVTLIPSSMQEVESVEPFSPGKDTDTEIESQLVAEQQAASRSQSQRGEVEKRPEAVVPVIAEEAMNVDVSPQQSSESVLPTPSEEHEDPHTAKQDDPIAASLEQLLSQLRSNSLSRPQVHKYEDMLMDIKRELYAAELRSRQ